eukprot:6190147-Pleurochrysis_carterae.AAC.4
MIYTHIRPSTRARALARARVCAHARAFRTRNRKPTAPRRRSQPQALWMMSARAAAPRALVRKQAQ